MLRELLYSIRAAIRGGTPSFSRAEEQLLSHVLAVLPEGDCSALRAQMDAVSLVQRQHVGRLVVAFYPKSKDVVRLPYPGYDHCLAKITYRSKGKKKTTAVVLHDGRLMSLEGNVPIAEGDIQPPVGVTLHPGKRSAVAIDIDAKEHGCTR